jgi:cysteine desulfurase / selenocysteine lyase
MKRRHFINSFSALIGGAILSKPGMSTASPLPLKEQIQSINDEAKFWQIIKKQFNFPKGYTYLNTGGIGAVPTLVLNEVNNYMNEDQIHPKPGHDHEEWDAVKEKCTFLLGPNCKKEELALISTATEGINIVINGLPLKKKDEIITSYHEHAALHIPLLNRMQRAGIVIRTFRPEFKNGLANVEKIQNLVTKKTKLIFLSHITCTTGQIFPLKEIGELAHQKSIYFAVDGAQAAGGRPFDVKDSNVDFYTFSGHKWTVGPKRTGVLYVREDLLETVRPITMGAYSDGGFDILKNELKLNPTAERYEYATQNPALFAGLKRSVDFVGTIGLQKIQDHNEKLAEMFYAGLKDIPGVQILSPLEKKYRSSIISFKIKDKDFRKVAGFLTEEKQIRVRVVPEAQVNGIRVSFHVYNNEEDVEKVLNEITNFLNT